MEIKKFGTEMAEELRHILGSEHIIEYKEIIKNNGIEHHALLIKKKTENIAPTIYIDDYFKAFEKGTAMAGLVKEVLKTFDECESKKTFDVSFFQDFSKVCTHLTFKVLNYEKNKKLLSDVPYKRVLDLALVPICMVSNRQLGEGSIVIKNSHIKIWEISFDELWENINEYANQILPIKAENIFDIVKGIDDSFSMLDFPCEMLVISNKSCTNGASAVFYPGVFEKLGKKYDGDFVILPSSIHETIVFKAPRDKKEIEVLVRMVREVNSTVLSSKDILSENVYYYERESGKLSLFGE